MKKNKLQDRIGGIIVNCLPNRIVYLAFLKVVALATQNRAGFGSATNVPKLLKELTVIEVVAVWEAKKNKLQYNRIVRRK